MRQIEFANLYVEKYDNGNLLLDFIVEGEFLFFSQNGDYMDSMRLQEYTPTMLLFKNVKNIRLYDGDIISVPMRTLIKYKNEVRDRNYYSNITDDEQPYNLFMTFNECGWFEEIIRSGEISKKNRLRKQFVYRLKGNWSGKPCALNRISDNVSIKVADVGQGSTNLICDGNERTIFDFGASIMYSQSMLENIVSDIEYQLVGFDNVSLIISHWDSDHYNLLSVMRADILKQFCCVFAPDEVITLTAKQIVKKLEGNCPFIHTFSSHIAEKKGIIGISPESEGANYVLYIGAKSKDSNKSGMALAVKGNNQVTVLAADHTNRQIWEHIYPHTVKKWKYDKLNIVVPHHGGNCGKMINKKNLSKKTGIAAISVGKNTYKHPEQATIDLYEELGFNVMRTDWERQNIFIDMG